MAPDEVQRKLTAILSADVEGYSRLMDDDEAATVRTLTAYRDVMSSLIRQHKGRVVDSPGDNLLADFTSVVDAVQCAVEIQQVLKAKNDELPDNRKMKFRIGINLGDVIVEGERIYGDGVNIAARVESLAEGGGICVSGNAYDQIRNKLALEYTFLGEQEVKNISVPVRVYKAGMEIGVAIPAEGRKEEHKPWYKRTATLVPVIAVVVAVFLIWNFYLRPSPPQFEPASIEKMAFPLPDKPSIAVLPFVNMSGDPEQEYLANGMAEDIITMLSAVKSLFVIARNSTFTYKGRAVKVQQVSEELGVRYVLEGSVQKSGSRVRITAQLVDAITGNHLWAERYDRELKDLFTLQDEITKKIVTELQIELTEGEQARWRSKGTDNLEAWYSFQKGLEHRARITKEDNVRARQLAQKAIELDPEFIGAYWLLAENLFQAARYGYSESPAKSLERSFELAQKALAMDDSFPDPHALLGAIYLQLRQHEKAIAEAEKAVALNPNGADNIVMLAYILNYSGRPEEAIRLTQRAMRLSPYYPSWYLGNLGYTYYLTRRYEEGIAANRECVERDPNFWMCHAVLGVIYSELGREEEARAELAETLRIFPDVSLELAAKVEPFKNPADLERVLNALRKAGLK